MALRLADTLVRVISRRNLLRHADVSIDVPKQPHISRFRWIASCRRAGKFVGDLLTPNMQSTWGDSSTFTQPVIVPRV
jgi:hypothetical protein